MYNINIPFQRENHTTDNLYELVIARGKEDGIDRMKKWFTQVDGRLEIALPSQAPDPDVSVVAVDFDGSMDKQENRR